MKNTKQNLHTHSVYCDGKDTPEQLIDFARAQGFGSLGFSGHSWADYSALRSVITPERTEEYKKKITALKAQYGEEFPVFLGLEVDMYSGVDQSGYDYLIGSVHYLKLGEEYLPFDHTPEEMRKLIRERFGGSGMTMAKHYFEAVAQLPRYGTFDIIGHFDLVTKNLYAEPFFDDTSKEYLSAALEAIHALRGKIPLFEVNTGAMAKGTRNLPYPALPLMREFRELGFGAVIASDCHDGRKLDCGFETARELLEACGFRERYILTDHGFEAVAL